MRTDAFIGTLVLCGLLTPAIACLILRRWSRLQEMPARLWLLLYMLGGLMCLVVLPRKHIESAIIMRWPQQFVAYNLAQVDNELWEQIGKLAALVIALWLVGMPLRRQFAEKRTAVALGYWTGLAYGLGEAVILAVLFAMPAWAPLFGMHTFTPYMVGWPYVYERLWAMHIHAVMGALIGLGLYGWVTLGSRSRLIGFFMVAMLYHHVVDGLIILALFVPAVGQVIQTASWLFVPLLLALGYLLLALAYRSQPSVGSRPLAEASFKDDNAALPS